MNTTISTVLTDTPATRLKHLRERLGLSQAGFAVLAGVAHATTVSRWETGRSTPQRGNLRTLAESFEVSFADLQAHVDHGEPIALTRAISRAPATPQRGNEAPLIETMRWTSDGAAPAQAGGDQRSERIPDDSMEPEFLAGDLVIVGAPGATPPAGTPCAVAMAGDRVVVRYVYPASASLVELRPGNHRHPSRLVRRETIRTIAPVVEIRRAVLRVTRNG